MIGCFVYEKRRKNTGNYRTVAKSYQPVAAHPAALYHDVS